VRSSDSRYPAVIAAAGGALVLAGCGSGHDAASQAPSSSGPARATASASASAPIASADGTDLKACADGRCEVRVDQGARIPVPRRLRVASVRVRSVSATAVTIVGSGIGNSSNSRGTGNFSAESTNGEFRITMGADSEVSQNGLNIAVVALQDEYAVLRLSPA
jgi:hypothetical protein